MAFHASKSEYLNADLFLCALAQNIVFLHISVHNVMWPVHPQLPPEHSLCIYGQLHGNVEHKQLLPDIANSSLKNEAGLSVSVALPLCFQTAPAEGQTLIRLHPHRTRHLWVSIILISICWTVPWNQNRFRLNTGLPLLTRSVKSCADPALFKKQTKEDSFGCHCCRTLR